MMRIVMLALLAAVAAGLQGCRERQDTAAAAESAERESPLYKKARDAELSGNIKEAIRLYRELLVQEPRAFSAHFQLATILQDSAEDYIGAIYHYHEYLQFRPESDKSKLAQERIRIAEQLLAPQILRRVGDSVEGITQAHLLKENDRLNRVITTLEGDKSKLAEERDKARKDLADLGSAYENLRKILEKMKTADAASPSAKPNIPKPRPAEAAPAPAGRTLKGVDIDAMRREAESLAAPAAPSSRAGGASEPSPDSNQKPSPKSDTKADPALRRPNRRAADAAATGKRTYVVQPGDSLFRVSEKFYGDSSHWKKIRNANRAVIDPDGRLHAGQTILIP